VYMLWFCAI